MELSSPSQGRDVLQYVPTIMLYALLVLVILELLIPSSVSAYFDLHILFVVALIVIVVKTVLPRKFL